MRRAFLFCAVAALAVSCSTKIDQVKSYPLFHASVEGVKSTKLYTGEDLNVYWNAKDSINLFNKSKTSFIAEFTGADGDRAGDFKVVRSGFDSEALNNVYAIYPYDASNAVTSEGVINFTFPGSQTYAVNSFGPKSNPMVAASADENLFFYNIGGYLHLKLYGENVSVAAIEVDSKAEEPLSGSATVTIAPGAEPEFKFADTDTKAYAFVDCTSSPVLLGADAVHATDFWIVLPPVALSQGFTVWVLDEEFNEFSLSYSSSIEIKRNTRINMPAAEVVFPEGATTEEIDRDLTGAYLISSKSKYESEGLGPYSNLVKIAPSADSQNGPVVLTADSFGIASNVELYGEYDAAKAVYSIYSGQVVAGTYKDDTQTTIIWIKLMMCDDQYLYNDDIAFNVTAPHELSFAYTSYGLNLLFAGYEEDTYSGDYDEITIQSIVYQAASGVAARAAARGYEVERGLNSYFHPRAWQIYGLKPVAERSGTQLPLGERIL
ncbi:MAG: hypothetical protein J6O51_08795 [Bacteroidales bacterium]|nr:hypothetical protein [Bacteroidales bacterium]